MRNFTVFVLFTQYNHGKSTRLIWADVARTKGGRSAFKKTKYMEIGRHRGMIANAHVKIGSNSYEKVKTFKYLGSKFYSGGNKK